MKKILIGCGVTILLLVVLAAGIITFGVVKVRKFTGRMEAAKADIVQLDKDFPFAVPESDTPMGANRFDAYLIARESMISRTMQIPFVSAIVESASSGQEPSITAGSVLKMAGEAPDLVLFYADTLREAQMSPDEYGWHAMATVEAVRAAAKAGDPEYQEIWSTLLALTDEIEKALQQQQSNPQTAGFEKVLSAEIERITDSTVPEENVTLVLGAKDSLAANPSFLLVELAVTMFLNNTYSPTGY